MGAIGTLVVLASIVVFGVQNGSPILIALYIIGTGISLFFCLNMPFGALNHRPLKKGSIRMGIRKVTWHRLMIEAPLEK